MPRASLGAVFVFAVAVAGPWSGALAQREAQWTSAAAPNGHFTVDTPCTAPEIAALRRAPAGLMAGVDLAPEARVLCSKGPWIFVAGEVNVEGVPAGSSFFDILVQQAAADPTAEGRPTQTTMHGRRAFVNRQEQAGVIAQTGFVEIGRTRIILLVSGSRDSSVGVDVQRQTIDHFFNSISLPSE